MSRPPPPLLVVLAVATAACDPGPAASDSLGWGTEPTAQAREALERGNELFESGDRPAGLAVLREATELAPGWPRAWRALAAAGWIAQDHATFLEAGARILAAEPNDAEMAAQLVDGALRAGVVDEAEAPLARLRELAPNTATTHLLHARFALETGDLAAAGEHASAAVRRDRSLATAHHILGLAAEERGEGNAAIEAYRKTLALEPGHLGARDALASLLLRMRRGDEAARHRQLHGAISDATGRHFRARPAAQRVAELGPLVEELPRWTFGRLELGRAYSELGRHADAVAVLEPAIERAPTYAELHQLLAEALERTGAANQAAKHFRIARQLGGVR